MRICAICVRTPPLERRLTQGRSGTQISQICTDFRAWAAAVAAGGRCRRGGSWHEWHRVYRAVRNSLRTRRLEWFAVQIGPARHSRNQWEAISHQAESYIRRSDLCTPKGSTHHSPGSRPPVAHPRSRHLAGGCATPSGLGAAAAIFPGCAAASRPWAVMCNPFGVQRIQATGNVRSTQTFLR